MKGSKMRKWILAVLATVTLTLGVGFATAYSAYAGTGNQWCDTTTQCLNAWNGGPLVKTYANGAVNNDFTVIGDYNYCNGGYTTSTCPGNGIPSGLPIVMFEDTDGGSYNGTCAEDNNNSQTDAKMGVGASCSGTGGWGSNFVQFYQPSGCDSGYSTFYNIHWQGYLYHVGGNGSQVYLNTTNPAGICLTAQLPA